MIPASDRVLSDCICIVESQERAWADERLYKTKPWVYHEVWYELWAQRDSKLETCDKDRHRRCLWDHGCANNTLAQMEGEISCHSLKTRLSRGLFLKARFHTLPVNEQGICRNEGSSIRRVFVLSVSSWGRFRSTYQIILSELFEGRDFVKQAPSQPGTRS